MYSVISNPALHIPQGFLVYFFTSSRQENVLAEYLI
jgi:hypothetical protein